MLKKRAVLYFLIMGFPIGLGAGAPAWLKIPQLAPAKSTQIETILRAEDAPVDLSWHDHRQINLPDFSAIHPLVVGTFTLLSCCGVLLAADQPQKS